MIFVEHGSIEASAPDEPDLPPHADLFEAAVNAVRTVRAVLPLGTLVEIAFVSDEEMRDLNARHRGFERPTDVLTFEGEGGGSIVIAIGVLRRQASLRGVAVPQEAAFLALHGALHLMGHDDEDPAARARMMEATAHYARSLGLPDVGEWSSVYEEAAA